MTVALDGRRPAAAVLAVACALVVVAACRRAPSPPGELSFDGTPLRRGTEFSRDGLSGVLFVTPGEPPATASVQVGFLVSERLRSGRELHDWVMAEYRSSNTKRFYESLRANEACKIGRGTEARPFIAVHVCRDAGGYSACAEADEKLSEADARRCTSDPCWEEVCVAQFALRRRTLEVLVRRVLHDD